MRAAIVSALPFLALLVLFGGPSLLIYWGLIGPDEAWSCVERDGSYQLWVKWNVPIYHGNTYRYVGKPGKEGAVWYSETGPEQIHRGRFDEIIETHRAWNGGELQKCSGTAAGKP